VSALLDEFRSVLSSYRNEVATWVNQGFVTSIDEHLKQLEAAAPAVEADGQAAVHRILTDLYTAWHAPASDAPAAPAAADTAPVQEPGLATGGTVADTVPVIVGESGPETVALPDIAPAAPTAAEDAVPAASADAPAADAAPVDQAGAAPAADTAAPAEN
jgi:hypothetical protein